MNLFDWFRGLRIWVWIGFSRYRKMPRYYNDLYDYARQDKASKIIQGKAAENKNATKSVIPFIVVFLKKYNVSIKN